MHMNKANTPSGSPGRRIEFALLLNTNPLFRLELNRHRSKLTVQNSNELVSVCEELCSTSYSTFLPWITL